MTRSDEHEQWLLAAVADELPGDEERQRVQQDTGREQQERKAILADLKCECVAVQACAENCQAEDGEDHGQGSSPKNGQRKTVVRKHLGPSYGTFEVGSTSSPAVSWSHRRNSHQIIAVTVGRNLEVHS